MNRFERRKALSTKKTNLRRTGDGMVKWTDAYERLTRRYVTAYSGDDKWQPAGWRYCIPGPASAPIYEKDSHCSEYWDRTFRIITDRPVSAATVYRALRDDWSRSCRCEHDCCGCVGSIVRTVASRGRREFIVTAGYHVNC